MDNENELNSKCSSLLEKAHDIVYKDRAVQYGDFNDHCDLVSELWSNLLGANITSKNVAMMMVLFKIAREIKSEKQDNIVDAMGYLELYSKLK